MSETRLTYRPPPWWMLIAVAFLSGIPFHITRQLTHWADQQVVLVLWICLTLAVVFARTLATQSVRVKATCFALISLVIVLSFAFPYQVHGLVTDNGDVTHRYITAAYFSAMILMAGGIGGIQPTTIVTPWVAVEKLIGYVLIGVGTALLVAFMEIPPPMTWRRVVVSAVLLFVAVSSMLFWHLFGVAVFAWLFSYMMFAMLKEQIARRHLGLALFSYIQGCLLLIALFGSVYWKTGVITAHGDLSTTLQDGLTFSVLTWTGLPTTYLRSMDATSLWTSSEAILGRLHMGVILGLLVRRLRSRNGG